MDTQSKEVRLVNHTYFLKDIQQRIDDIKVGDIVFIKIRSPLHYGNKEGYSMEKFKRLLQISFGLQNMLKQVGCLIHTVTQIQ